MIDDKEKLNSTELREGIRNAIISEYRQHVGVLNHIHFTEFIPELSGLGIRDADGNGYPIPALENILSSIDRNRELVEWKWQQGFQHLLLTPIAMPFWRFMQIAERELRAHDQSHTLFLQGKFGSQTQRRTELNQTDPLDFSWLEPKLNEKWQLYFPNHLGAGMKKTELISKLEEGPFRGWNVCLIEDFTPGHHQTAREEDFSSRSSRSFHKSGALALFEEPAHFGEVGLTCEDFLAHFLHHLQITNEISNDERQFNGVVCLGNFFSGLRGFPRVCWLEFRNQMSFSITDPSYKPLRDMYRTEVQLT